MTILSGPLDSGSSEVRIMNDRVCSNQVTCMLMVSLHVSTKISTYSGFQNHSTTGFLQQGVWEEWGSFCPLPWQGTWSNECPQTGLLWGDIYWQSCPQVYGTILRLPSNVQQCRQNDLHSCWCFVYELHTCTILVLALNCYYLIYRCCYCQVPLISFYISSSHSITQNALFRGSHSLLD